LSALLQKLPSLEQVKQEKARRHLIDFIQYTLPNYSNPAHQVLLAQKLEAVERGEIKRLMVFMPPRHLKPLYLSSHSCTSSLRDSLLGKS